MKKINIGLAGLGTVGSGVARIIQTNREMIAQKTGLSLELKAVLDINFAGRENLLPTGCIKTSDLEQFLAADTDVVVELIGGYTFAKTLMEKAIDRGKHIVTANKALLALHGKEIFEKIQSKGIQIKYEASVCGAIPIIQTIEKALAQNNIQKIDAILNGTSNYILTRMHEEGLPYPEILKDAQKLGFAESDPTFDVEGMDAAHKLAILANLSFGSHIPFEQISIQGIKDLELMDFQMADKMGYVIKPLGITKIHKNCIEARVHPAMVPRIHPLAAVRLENNGIYYQTDFTGPGFLFGKGAGSLPTGSAVVGDIVQLGLQSQITNNFSTKANFPIAGLDKIFSKFYFRLSTLDKPGMLSKIAGILGAHNISIASVVQMETGLPSVPLCMMTHESQKSKMIQALEEIKKLDEVSGKIVLIHVEE
jgi:homoserine dehydrogenase